MESKSVESIDSLSELKNGSPPVRRGLWARYFPYGFWNEWKHLAILAIPIMVTSLSNYIIVPVSLSFVGRLGSTELAAAGLATSIFHVAGVSIIFGLLTASETLFSQTFGGENKFRLGVQVQRAVVILTFACFPCAAIYIIIEPILLTTKQPPLVAKYTGYYLLGMIPALFFVTIIEVAAKYIQAQNKVYPPLFASIAANLANAASHYLFCTYTSYGFVGSALSQSIAYMVQAIVIVGYIIVSKMYKTTWDRVHIELWHDWGIWFSLAIPGMMMSGMEWWVCESGSIMSGLRGEKELSVQTILNNVESLVYCSFPLGFCIATTIRIGQFLGANRADGPLSTALVSLITVAFFATVNGTIIFFSRFHIPLIFTNSPEIIDLTAYSLLSVMCFQFVGGVVGICSGVIRGVGMQRVGAIVCIVCMYCVGGPVGLSLLMLTDLSVSGFWWGLTIGMGIECVIYITIILKIDWHKMCEKAAKRTEIKFVNAPTSPELEIEIMESLDTSIEEEGDVEKVSTATTISGSEVKACTPRIIVTRMVLVGFCVMTVVAALCCQFLIDWRSYFPSYCLTANNTLVPIANRSSTSHIPGSCERIVP